MGINTNIALLTADTKYSQRCCQPKHNRLRFAGTTEHHFYRESTRNDVITMISDPFHTKENQNVALFHYFYVCDRLKKQGDGHTWKLRKIKRKESTIPLSNHHIGRIAAGSTAWGPIIVEYAFYYLFISYRITLFWYGILTPHNFLLKTNEIVVSRPI